jgi:hypothetical protein
LQPFRFGGNPHGRRRGAGNMLAAFKKIALQRIRVRIAGTVRVITWCQYVILADYYAALGKNQNAMNNILRFAEDIGQFINQDDFRQMGAPIAQSQPLTPEQFETLFGNSLPDAQGKPPHGKR